jgi:hypothetical protein
MSETSAVGGATVQEPAVKVEYAIRILAGSMVLISVSLAHWVSQWWLLLAVFVGVNLIQSAFTGFCPAENILRKLGVGSGKSCCCGPAKSNGSGLHS